MKGEKRFRVSNRFAKYGCIPYIAVLVGLVVVLVSEEWKNLNAESTGVPTKHVTRRDIDADLREKYYYGELNKLQFTPPKAEEVAPELSAEIPSVSPKVLLEDSPLISPDHQPEVNKPVEMDVSDSGSDVHQATVAELKPLVQPLGSAPKNPRYIFHNKIPKAGSTTMKWLLVALANKNKFTLDHVRPCVKQETCTQKTEDGHHVDGPDGEQAMIDYVPNRRKEAGEGNFFMLKHHHWFNFTQFGMEVPTYMNVVRDPVTRYASWYYFERYGWARHEGTRKRFFGDGEDKERSFDDCVLEGHPECLEPLQVLVRYFCGTDVSECGMMAGEGHDWTMVAKATERAKRIIAEHFYVVGVLEHFTTSLQLFEKMLPEYFSGALEALQTPDIQKQRDSSKSSNGEIGNQTRHILETGVLRYEVDIYNLVKSLFYEKLRYYDIPMPF